MIEGVGLRYALVVHHFWDRPGGGELLSAASALGLEAFGYAPVLVSVFSLDPSKYVDWFGIDLSKYPRYSLFGFKLRAFGLYSRLINWAAIEKALERYGAELVFTDSCFYGRIEKQLVKKRVKLLEYIHYPIELELRLELKRASLHYAEDPYFMERYGRFPLNIYWRLFVSLAPRFIRENPFNIASAVLTNSNWTAELVEKLYGEKPQVLNPPIAPNVEIIEEPRDFVTRENSIVMIGRFSEEMRYHWVVEKLVPKLAKEVGGLKLYIFGGTRTKTSMSYLSRVESLAVKAGLRVSRSLEAVADVYLIADAPRKTINEIADSSKVFLHATVNEHWGIAVAEAMARGLPVVVHKSGGAWSDLVSMGAFGFGYDDEVEAVESIARLMTDENQWRNYSRRSIKRAKEFTLEKFVEKFTAVLRKIA